ncbi:MAG: rhomboid family intramembrane serine protease [Deltaproteobacteria bacterium]|nr:rhomboid family intramembrane serine protease [Deltaproteobacteria bacterium]
MIPIRDTIRSRNYPIVNVTLIAINVAIFLLQPANQAELQHFVITYGLVPARYTVDTISQYFTFGQQVVSLFSFMFLHGGFWHLVGNMWFLYIFGDNVEDRLGPIRYLAFYLLCGWASALAHVFFNVQSQVPIIGASGAIAGVMGAYFILYPRARVLTLIPIIIIPYFIEIPAFFFLAIWFAIQFFSATLSGTIGGGGIAWWAHVGGFVAGIIFLGLFTYFPRFGASDAVRRSTVKKKTPRLQVIKPIHGTDGYDVYGDVAITRLEAFKGTRKIVNIPLGFRKRLFRVNIPPGTKDGVTLRLTGLGEKSDAKKRGDAYIKILVKPD